MQEIKDSEALRIDLTTEWNENAKGDLYKYETKGIELTEQNIDDFGVSAYYEDGIFDMTSSIPNFMNNVKVNKIADNQWDYSPIMYWPTSGTVSFFAYSPYEVTVNGSLLISSYGMPIYRYTQPVDIKQQKDLLLAYPIINKSKLDLNSDKKLPLKFKHALSSVVFNAYVMNEQVEPVKVTSIIIQSLRSKKQAVFASASSGVTNYQDWLLTWSDVSDSLDENYELSIDNECLFDMDIKANTTAINITRNDGNLIVLPQQVDDTDMIIVTSIMGGEVKRKEMLLKTLVPVFEVGMRYTISIKVISRVDVDIVCTVAPWEIKNIIVPDFD